MRTTPMVKPNQYPKDPLTPAFVESLAVRIPLGRLRGGAVFRACLVSLEHDGTDRAACIGKQLVSGRHANDAGGRRG